MAIVCTDVQERNNEVEEFYNNKMDDEAVDMMTTYFSNRNRNVITGIITMENILEGLLGIQITDEIDKLAISHELSGAFIGSEEKTNHYLPDDNDFRPAQGFDE